MLFGINPGRELNSTQSPTKQPFRLNLATNGGHKFSSPRQEKNAMENC